MHPKNCMGCEVCTATIHSKVPRGGNVQGPVDGSFPGTESSCWELVNKLESMSGALQDPRWSLDCEVLPWA